VRALPRDEKLTIHRFNEVNGDKNSQKARFKAFGTPLAYLFAKPRGELPIRRWNRFSSCFSLFLNKRFKNRDSPKSRFFYVFFCTGKEMGPYGVIGVGFRSSWHGYCVNVYKLLRLLPITVEANK
jgi:hypothetical protein